MNELKPCPFCGEPALVETLGDEDDGSVSCRISCKRALFCGATQRWFGSYEEAKDAWNRRINDHE